MRTILLMFGFLAMAITMITSLTAQSAAAAPVVCSKSGACAGTTFSTTGQPGANILGGNGASAGSIFCAGKPAARLGPSNSNILCSG